MSFYLMELETPETGERYLESFGDASELTARLGSLVETVHYSGTGDAVYGIWRWLGDGQTGEMNLRLAGEKREAEDWLDWYYVLEPVDGEGEDIRFTVRIDGRS